MDIKSAWNAGMRHPSFFLPAVLIVGVSIGTLALELVFPPKVEVSSFRATWHTYQYGEKAPPLEPNFKEKYPYRAYAIGVCAIGSLFLGYFSYKAEQRLRKSRRLRFWDAFSKEIQALFDSRSEYTSRDWNATDVRLAIKELERDVVRLEAKNDEGGLATAHWKLDFLRELLPTLERKEKGQQTTEDDVIANIRSRLQKKFKSIQELYALQAEVMEKYKDQVNVNKELMKRIDLMFKRELAKLMGDDPDV